jgi:hypothetical protein
LDMRIANRQGGQGGIRSSERGILAFSREGIAGVRKGFQDLGDREMWHVMSNFAADPVSFKHGLRALARRKGIAYDVHLCDLVPDLRCEFVI